MSSRGSAPPVGGGLANSAIADDRLSRLSDGAQPARANRPPAAMLLRKLTTSLLETYKVINNHYYAKKAKEKAATAAAQREREAGAADYVVNVGDILGGRYKVTESLGKGSFGQVVGALDTLNGDRKVAVKVIKAREAFRKQAKTEISILKRLNDRDNEDRRVPRERFFALFTV